MLPGDKITLEITTVEALDGESPFVVYQTMPVEPRDTRPWATWKSENLLASPSFRLGYNETWPRSFTVLPYLAALVALR